MTDDDRRQPLRTLRPQLKIDEGQGDGESRALSYALAFGPHRAAVQFDQLANDGEAETHASVNPVGAGVGLAKAVEDVRQEFGIDAHPGILHLYLYARAGASQPDRYLPVRVRELDGVRDEIPDHLLQAVGVAVNRPGARVERRRQADA